MFVFFFFNDTATTEIYTLSLHDALPISFNYGLRIFDSLTYNKPILEMPLVYDEDGVPVSSFTTNSYICSFSDRSESTRLNSSHIPLSRMPSSA